MFSFVVSAQTLLVAVAAALSLLFDYFPGLSQKYDALDESKKRLIMFGLVTLFATIVFIGQCYGYFTTNLFCTAKNALDLVYDIVVTLAVNYSFHKVTKPSASFKQSVLSFTAK